jgi:putative intracellular protease/amidase
VKILMVLTSHDWESFALVDGGIVTGQNPASST